MNYDDKFEVHVETVSLNYPEISLYVSEKQPCLDIDGKLTIRTAVEERRKYKRFGVLDAEFVEYCYDNL